MHDSRYHDLARVLISHSTALKAGERVLIDAFDIPDEFIVALVRAVRAAKGVPFVQIQHARISRELAMEVTEAQLDISSTLELARMKKMDAYIAIRGSHNITEMSDVPDDRMQLLMGKMRPVLDWRINRTKWVVLRWPTPAMAQQGQKSTEAFEEFYFKVCTLDYSRMTPGM